MGFHAIGIRHYANSEIEEERKSNPDGHFVWNQYLKWLSEEDLKELNHWLPSWLEELLQVSAHFFISSNTLLFLKLMNEIGTSQSYGQYDTHYTMGGDLTRHDEEGNIVGDAFWFITRRDIIKYIDAVWYEAVFDEGNRFFHDASLMRSLFGPTMTENERDILNIRGYILDQLKYMHRADPTPGETL